MEKEDEERKELKEDEDEDEVTHGNLGTVRKYPARKRKVTQRYVPEVKTGSSRKKRKLKKPPIATTEEEERVPMPESERKYPTPMPEKLPEERPLEDLYMEKPSLKILGNHIDKHNFYVSNVVLLEDEPVLHQRDYDACWAFGPPQAMEYIAKFEGRIDYVYLRSLYGKDEPISSRLSPQCLINCVPAVHDKDHLKKWFDKDECYKSSVEDALQLIMHRGIALEKDVPYEGPYMGYQRYRKSVFIQDYFFVPLGWTALEIAAAIMSSLFVIGTFSTGEDFEEFGGNVFYHVSKDKITGRHIALITGARKLNGRFYLEIRNTYGTTWGKDGCSFIEKKLFTAILGVTKPRISSVENFMNSGEAAKDFKNVD